MDNELNSCKAVTIGTFDGVHRGHVAVLDMLKAEARSRGLTPAAMTFDRHPLELIAPEKAPGNLLSTARKSELIRGEGVLPIVLAFNEAVRGMRAYEWLRLIHRRYGVRLLVLGYDNTFGCDGVDLSLSDIKAMGDAVGIEVLEAPEVSGVSSSRIRKAVSAGDMESAADMLGRMPELEGRVVSGFHVGSEIGFPTANVQVHPGMVVPAGGVYAATAFIAGSGEAHCAMVNIGVRPTFENTPSRSDHTTVEAHVIGLDEVLYGKTMRLEFLARLRDEHKFASVDALRRQLEADRSLTIRLCGKTAE